MEIRNDALGHHLTDAFHLHQFFERGILQRIDVLEVARQQFAGSLAHKTDAQGKDHTLEGYLPGGVDAFDDILCRESTVFVTTRNLGNAEVIEVGHVVNQSAAPVFIHRLGTQRHDVHRLTRDEMFYAPLYLRRTTAVVGTVVNGLALVAHQRRTAFRAACDELYGLCDDGTLVDIHPHNLGDDLAAFLHIDIVADVQVETLDEVLVVQRGALHRGASQLHGFHVGNGGNGSRASYLIGHFIQPRTGPFGLELIGDGPSRRLGRESQVPLLALGVHLQHDAVGGHRQVLALLVPVVDEIVNLLQGLHLLHPLRDFEAPRLCRHQVFIMAVAGNFLAQQVIKVGIQPTACHHLRLLRLQRAAGGISGIGKQRFLGSLTLGIQPFKRFPGHQHLAADFKLTGIIAPVEHQRNAPDGLHVPRHVIPLNAITARYGLCQPPVHISQRDAQPVVFHFAAHLERLALQALLHALVPGSHVLFVISVRKREHRIFVSHLPELLIQVAAYALGRTVRVSHLGMAGLKFLQFVHQEVEFLVADCRLVLNVVAMVMLVEFAPKL